MYTDPNLKVIEPFIGKVITDISFNDDELYIWFGKDGLKVFDDGQSCCEDRFMTTSDAIQLYVGDKFVGYEVVDAPDVIDKYYVHEVSFLRILTDQGSFTMESHNEHNGYYGGFHIVFKVVHRN